MDQKLSPAVKSFLTEFKTNVLPVIKQNKHCSISISGAQTRDPQLQQLLGMARPSDSEAQFMGIRVNTKPDMQVEIWD